MTLNTGYQLVDEIFAGFFICLAGLLLASAPLQARDWIEDSYLIDVRMGSDLSQNAREYGKGGYELSDGSPVQFGDWYSSDWRDLSVTFLTEVNANMGFLWGFGTGEVGQKYKIDPSLVIGLILQTEPSRNSLLSFSATTRLWGYLKEETCVADYGAIGGVQKVNFRLAASTLPPEETLEYLFDVAPADQVQLQISYVFNF